MSAFKHDDPIQELNPNMTLDDFEIMLNQYVKVNHVLLQNINFFSLREDLVKSTPEVLLVFIFFCISRPGYYVQHGYFF